MLATIASSPPLTAHQQLEAIHYAIHGLAVAGLADRAIARHAVRINGRCSACDVPGPCVIARIAACARALGAEGEPDAVGAEPLGADADADDVVPPVLGVPDHHW